MNIRECYLNYVKENYRDIAFNKKSEFDFPDIETGYTQVKIVYNASYHTLDMRFNGMGNYESIFGKYIYPVLMKHREFSLWKMASSRVIRVKVPCINEELGFIEEDCDVQMEYVRTLMEILSKIDVARMYSERREIKEMPQNDDAIAAEISDFVADYKEELQDRREEKEAMGSDAYCKKGILYRLSSMSKDITQIIMTYSDYITRFQKSKLVSYLMQYKNETEELIKEVL